MKRSLALSVLIFTLGCVSSHPKDPCGTDFASEECARKLVQEDSPDDVIIMVDESPRPLGGMRELFRNLVYPEEAKKVKVEGVVLVEFSVDVSGQAHDAKIVRGLGSGCDEAAVSAVLLTVFTPGRYKGKAVPVRLVMPIEFRLK